MKYLALYFLRGMQRLVPKMYVSILGHISANVYDITDAKIYDLFILAKTLLPFFKKPSSSSAVAWKPKKFWIFFLNGKGYTYWLNKCTKMHNELLWKVKRNNCRIIIIPTKFVLSVFHIFSLNRMHLHSPGQDSHLALKMFSKAITKHFSTFQ